MSAVPVPFLFRPESPLPEVFESLTSVLVHKDGTEQRIALRTAPRQSFQMTVQADISSTRAQIENTLWGNQSSTFAVPLWPDVTYLTSSCGVDASTVFCNTTQSDFRVGDGIMFIRNDDNLVDYSYPSTITAVTSSSITVAFGTEYAWPAGTQVYPVRNCIIKTPVKSNRGYTNVTNYSILFESVNNAVNLAGTGAASTVFLPASTGGFNVMGFGPDTGALILDDPNMIEESAKESSDISVVVVDGQTGVQSDFSYKANPNRGSAKTFVSNQNRTRQWQLRLLAHYLAGRQTAFLMPTFGNDILLQQDLTVSTSTMSVFNTGITANAALGKDPRVYLRVYNTANSTTGYNDFQVLSTAVSNSITEFVYVTPLFPYNIPASTVSRVCVLEKTRAASDSFKCSHSDLLGTMSMSFPTLAILA